MATNDKVNTAASIEPSPPGGLSGGHVSSALTTQARHSSSSVSGSKRVAGISKKKFTGKKNKNNSQDPNLDSEDSDEEMGELDEEKGSSSVMKPFKFRVDSKVDERVVRVISGNGGFNFKRGGSKEGLCRLVDRLFKFEANGLPHIDGVLSGFYAAPVTFDDKIKFGNKLRASIKLVYEGIENKTHAISGDTEELSEFEKDVCKCIEVTVLDEPFEDEEEGRRKTADQILDKKEAGKEEKIARKIAASLSKNSKGGGIGSEISLLKDSSDEDDTDSPKKKGKKVVARTNFSSHDIGAVESEADKAAAQMTIAFATNMASSSKRQDELRALRIYEEQMNEVREKIEKLNAQKGRLRMSLAGL